MKLVSVITVNFNNTQVTEALLNSIAEKNTYQAIEIIVVDNGSDVNPISQWMKKYPYARFVRSEKNLGFAGGNNLGVKEASGEYLFFVNNDTEFTPGLVEELVHTLDIHPEIGIISPGIKYFDQPEIIQYAGFSRMNYYTARTSCIGQFEKDNGQYDHLTGETGFIHGAAMMVRKEAIDKAGLMYENYFLYYEEMDWCERIRQQGFKVWVDMQATIYHKESMTVGSTSALKEYFMNRNRILFIRRNCPLSVRAVFWPYFIFVVTPRNIIGYMAHKQMKFIKVLFRAIAWNMTNNTESKVLGFNVKNIA